MSIITIFVRGVISKQPLHYVFSKYISLFINNSLIPFKVVPLRYNTLMPTFFLPLKHFRKWAFGYCQYFPFRFIFFTSIAAVLGRGKSRREQSLVNTEVNHASTVFAFDQNVTHKHRCMRWCIIMVQYPWLVFLQFCESLINCFVQQNITLRWYSLLTICNWRKHFSLS